MSKQTESKIRKCLLILLFQNILKQQFEPFKKVFVIFFQVEIQHHQPNPDHEEELNSEDLLLV